ncbi:hypothetical protein, partial [Vibrio cholerae]|uniref:hypothetical protein n=1 Tax=Vibrio cholerae TaxID=666 RepID=UPI001F243896
LIVAPAQRGRGLDRRVGHERRARLLGRLEPGAAVGGVGGPAMRGFYARGGFRAAGRSVRFEGIGAAAPTPAGLVDAREQPFEDLLA